MSTVFTWVCMSTVTGTAFTWAWLLFRRWGQVQPPSPSQPHISDKEARALNERLGAENQRLKAENQALATKVTRLEQALAAGRQVSGENQRQRLLHELGGLRRELDEARGLVPRSPVPGDAHPTDCRCGSCAQALALKAIS